MGKTPPEAGDYCYVTNHTIKHDNSFGAKGKVLEVSRHQVKVKLLTSGKVQIFDEIDVSITGMF